MLHDSSRPTVLKREEASHIGKIVTNRLLTKPGVPAKHHIGMWRVFGFLELDVNWYLEIALPEDMIYEAGDYISILPRNPVENITRVLSRFSLLPDQNVSGRPTRFNTLTYNIY